MNLPDQLKELCGGDLIIWDQSRQKFGSCFESLVFVCPIFVILGITSAFYVGNKRRRVKRSPPYNYLLCFRFVITFLLTLCPVIILTLNVLDYKRSPSIMSYVAFGVSVFGWTLHLIYVWTLRTAITVHSRGSCLVVFTWALTLITTGVRIASVIENPDLWSDVKAEPILVYVSSILQVFYLASLIPKGMGEVSSMERQLLTVNVEDDERTLLLHSGSFNASYTQLAPSPVWSYLGVALEGSNFLRQLTFRWVLPLMERGAKKLLLAPEYLFELPHSMRTAFVDTKFWILYKDMQLRNGVTRVSVDAESSGIESPQIVKEKVSLLRVLVSCFGVEYFLLGIPKFFADSLTFVSPLLLQAIVNFKEDSSSVDWHGYCYVFAMFAVTLVVAFLSTQFQFRMNNVGLKIRATLISAIYRKSLSSNTCAMMKVNTGEIVNYMSTDTDRIQNFCPSFHQFWSIPLQIIFCMVLLYTEVGLAFLAGIGFAFVLIPINRCIANKIGKYSKSMMNQKDKRVKLMNEILRGISAIKFHAWEKYFSKFVSEARAAELESLKKRKYLDAACVYFWATTPVLINLLTFLTFTLLGYTLTASKVFTCLTLVNMLIMPLNAFPWVINGLVEAWVSLQRIENLMQLPDSNILEFYTQHKDETVPLMMNAELTWSAEDATNEVTLNSGFSLNCINLCCKQGQLIGIIGAVGSGKTSLMHAILAEMNKVRGQIGINDITDGFGFVPQESWILQGTVKSNILLGKNYDSVRYKQVIDACCLVEDLALMPNGDEAQVGERGITLSGGQKARISLARACYQDKKIYLLDDPLSAVDAHVAKHIFDNCISGLLKQKTRILCTHQLKFMKYVDWVVVMQNGKIKTQGDSGDIMPIVQSLSSFAEQLGGGERAQTHSNKEPEVPDLKENCDDVLISEEERESGSVKFGVYSAYANAIGPGLVLIVMIALLFMQGTRNATDLWLAYWTANSNISSHNTSNLSDNMQYDIKSSLDANLQLLFVRKKIDSAIDADVTYYLMVYGILVGCNSIFSFFRAFFFAYGGIVAATNIHVRLLSGLFKAPISFFEKNPIGRILNRFSSDLYAVDDSLPFMLNILLAQTFALLGTIIITCYSLPWIVLLIIPLIAVYMNIQDFYRHTSRELKRLSAVSLSSIYAHFSETLSGLTSIRAFRVEAKFRKENEDALEKNQRVQFSSQAAGQWLNFSLQLIGVCLITGVSLLVILTPISLSLAGLAISYALTVTGYLNGVVWSFTETEKEMVNAERALEYINGLGSEKWDGIIDVPPNWPNYGSISFSHVYLQYREHLPFSLSDVTFFISPAEKIGIVGRTGAGKSSLINVLFRLTEIQKGDILIDDVNIKHLDLNTLRSCLAVIPQDPFIFSGTVRENLDPGHEFSDPEIWMALEQCHLSDVVKNIEGLGIELADRGCDLSQGQKQLFCLARALLAKTKVLCIDEATASVDLDTDSLIQRTIRSVFKDCTVITIAHRIETILHCDRVIVMSNSRVQEMDSPKQLLSDPESLFYKLVNNV